MVDPIMRKDRAGTTLLEMVIVTVIFTVGWGVFLIASTSTQNDFAFHSARSTLLQWNQRIVNDIRDDTLATKSYFESNSFGSRYFEAIELDQASPPIGSLRLATIDEDGGFAPDTPSDQKTGNALFFVKTLPPLTATIAIDEINSKTYSINAYQFVLYYLTLRPDERVGDHDGTLDLMRWSSLPVADYGQIMAIEDPDPDDTVNPQTELAAAFKTKHNSTWLWDAGKEVDNAFYKYVAEEGGIDPTPTPDMQIPRDPDDGIRSVIPATMTKVKQASICFNRSTPGWGAGPAVPQFAVEDTAGDGFPHGFEIQLVGTTGSRRLMMRVALAKGVSRKTVTKAFNAVLTTRDF